MKPRCLIAAAFIAAYTTVGVSQNISAGRAESDKNIQVRLQSLAKFSPDPCGRPYGADQDSSDIESAIFRAATDEVTRALNSDSTRAKSPAERATERLQAIQKISADANAAGPDENRFQFEILDLSPALVVKLAIRSNAHYFVFGVPAEDDTGKPNRKWREVGSDDENNRLTWLRLDIYPLHRGPEGNPRFLAKFIESGCAGSVGVSYDVREWTPTEFGSFDQVIKISGAFGLDDKVPGFSEIGELKTKGPLITLPYCWFSPIDTWDNPSMCAVDTYDLSGDTVKFRTRTYNRPDLLPIAKALEYAQHRDYPAVLAYCASPAVARALVRTAPSSVFGVELKTKRIASGLESVTSDGGFTFVVAKHNGRWLVTKFSTN